MATSSHHFKLNILSCFWLCDHIVIATSCDNSENTFKSDAGKKAKFLTRGLMSYSFHLCNIIKMWITSQKTNGLIANLDRMDGDDQKMLILRFKMNWVIRYSYLGRLQKKKKSAVSPGQYVECCLSKLNGQSYLKKIAQQSLPFNYLELHTRETTQEFSLSATSVYIHLLERKFVCTGVITPKQKHMDYITAVQTIDTWHLVNNSIKVEIHVCDRDFTSDQFAAADQLNSGLSPSATPQGYCRPRTRFPLTSIMVLLPTTARGKRSCRVEGGDNCCIAPAQRLKIHCRLGIHQHA